MWRLLSFFFCVRCSLLFWVMFYHSYCGRAVGQPCRCPQALNGAEHRLDHRWWAGCLSELAAGLNYGAGFGFLYSLAEGFSTICELFVDSSGSHVLEYIWVRERRGWGGTATSVAGCRCTSRAHLVEMPLHSLIMPKILCKSPSHRGQILLACLHSTFVGFLLGMLGHL